MRVSKGFTLIELILVIGMIGILASVILASLNSQRNEAVDASAQASMKSMQVGAQICMNRGDVLLNPLVVDTPICAGSDAEATELPSSSWRYGSSTSNTDAGTFTYSAFDDEDSDTIWDAGETYVFCDENRCVVN